MSKTDGVTNGAQDVDDVVFRIGVGILLGLITVAGLMLALPQVYRLGPEVIVGAFIFVFFLFLNTLVVASALRLAAFMALRDCSRMSIVSAPVIIGLAAFGIQWFAYDVVVGLFEEAFVI